MMSAHIQPKPMSLGFKVLFTLRAIVVALVFIGVSAAAMRFGIVPVLQAIFDLDDSRTSIVRRVGMIIAFAFGYWLHLRIVEKRSASELAIKPLLIVLAGLIGALAIGLPIAVLFAFDIYTVVETNSGTGIVGIALVIFAAAFLEEVIFRGVLFRIVEKWFGVWVALILPSMLFSALHVFNDNWSGWLPLISVVLLGLMWSLVYIYTRNIWACALNHAMWNYTIFLTGLPLTGLQEWRPLAPIKSEFHGAIWLSGGSAGPEVTLLSIVVVLTSVAVFVQRLRKVTSQHIED
jgi:membrane protease YdiL (CAAX protease family)